MKIQNIVSKALLCASICSLAACGDGDAQSRYDAERYTVGNAAFSETEVREVDVEWLGGSVEVEQSARQISITEEETGQTEAERMRYSLDEGVLKIKYCRSGMRNRIAGEGKHLLVTIPAGVALHLEYTSAVVSVGNLQTSEFSAEGTSGNFTAERIVCDEAELETDSGSMTVGEIVCREFSVETEGGNVSVSKLSTDILEGKIGDGTLYLGLQKAAKTREALESKKGNITLAFENGLSAEIVFQTTSGRLQTEKPYQKEGSKYYFSGAKERDVCSFSVKTQQGNVTVR